MYDKNNMAKEKGLHVRLDIKKRDVYQLSLLCLMFFPHTFFPLDWPLVVSCCGFHPSVSTSVIIVISIFIGYCYVSVFICLK